MKFPGLIDIHVHVREPGATHKEDFLTASRAAVAGGFTYILDMPNNPIPTFSKEALDEKIRLSQNAVCDIGFHYGTNGKNFETFESITRHPRVFGLKLYCNHTTGDYLIDDIYQLEKVFSEWKSEKPILVHAEGKELAAVIGLAHLYNRHLHICHLSQAIEVQLVRRAKYKKQWITAGVTPHHLFLTEKDVKKLKGYAVMKPQLGTQKDQDALWQGLLDGSIDLVESDHAPHTTEEKKKNPPAYGVPGLETTLGLLLKAVHEKKLTIHQLKTFLYDAPKTIFSIPDQLDTYIVFDPNKPWVVNSKNLKTKCSWSPFDGWELYGKVEKVVLKGNELFYS